LAFRNDHKPPSLSTKHGRVTDNREWVKLHLMCGTATKVVTGVEVSGWTAHDTNYFVPLVERTAVHFDVEQVSADNAYLSHKNASAVEGIGATPFIPFKSNSLPPAEDSAWSRMYHYFMFNREEFLAHYHRRSSVESVFSMVKAKFGDSVRSKSDTGQVNEALCKVLCHNICVLIHAMHALDVHPIFVQNLRLHKNCPFRSYLCATPP
jgi:Transposase DDE domain